MSLKKLPPATAKCLSSSQVITSVCSAVKELVENALDSGANMVDVKLVNYGLDKIEVQDNGSGVHIADVEHMCLPHYTSKIEDFADLGCKLETYGFRGEALSSLCNVADVIITTRTSDDEYASVFTFDNNGKVLEVKPSHFGKGTTVTILNIFRNMPVRKQFISASNKPKIELQRTEIMVKNLAIINSSVRFSFCHNKCLVWHKLPAQTLKDSVKFVLGNTASNLLEEVSTIHKKNYFVLLLPRKYCNGIDVLCSATVDAIRIFINQRPVRHKKLQKVVTECISEHFGNHYPKGKYPTCIVSIQIAPSDLDVNIEPNKTKVICHEEDRILAVVESLCESYYKPMQQQNAKRARLEEEEEMNLQPSSTSVKELSDGEIIKKSTSENINVPFSVASELRTDAQWENITGDSNPMGLSVPDTEKFSTSVDISMNEWSRGCLKSTSGDIIEGSAVVLMPKNNISNVESLRKGIKTTFSQNSECVEDKTDKTSAEKFYSLFDRDSAVMLAPKKNISHAESVKKGTKTALALNSKYVKTNKANRTSIEKFISFRSVNTESWKPEKKNLDTLKSTTWDISVNDLKSMLQQKNTSVESREVNAANFEIELLYPLISKEIWICKNYLQIGFIRPKCLKEKLYYKRLMQHCSIPVIPLDRPILLKPEDFDIELWQSLQRMETENVDDNKSQIMSPLILKNGLNLIWQNEKLYLTHVASTIRFYGKEELIEILNLMKISLDLDKCRPDKIAAYLESEAVRVANSSMDREYIMKMMQYLDLKNDLCLHKKPIFRLLYTLPHNSE